MCTQISEDITTEIPPVVEPESEVIENEPEPRDVYALLALPTYQGMTDKEIDLIIKYHVHHAISDAEYLLKTQITITEMEAKIQNGRINSQRALDMIEYLIEYPHTVEPVQPLKFEPRSLELSNES